MIVGHPNANSDDFEDNEATLMLTPGGGVGGHPKTESFLPGGGSEKPGDFIGRYRLLSFLGEGGFGTVWRAEQSEPIHREVALKVIKLGMDTREIIARFEAERQALALMDHPNIAGVLEAGATAAGRPYFAMLFVRGVSLTEHCDTHQLTIRQRVELLVPVCQAVQHAHQKAILHRDLKPSNILVTETDGKSVPMVIDFGIAKALGVAPEAVLKASLIQTQAGMVIGTPQYMSPEQAGSVLDVDTRSDIYALGVILYELLTGRTPLTVERLSRTSLDEMLRLVREEEPGRPSSQFSRPTDEAVKTAILRGTDVSRLRNAIRGELDWITLKALDKDRARRYETANDLALDLQRFLNHEPVNAASPSTGYRLKKLVQRNKATFVTAALVFMSLVAGLSLALKMKLEADVQRDEARYNEGLGWLLRAEVAEERKNQYPGALLYAAQAIGFDGLGRPDNAPPTLLRYVRPERNPGDYQKARSWVAERPAYLPVWASPMRPAAATGLSVSREGRWLAMSTADGCVTLWDFRENKETAVLAATGEAAVDVAFCPARDSLAIAIGGRIRHWDLAKNSFTEEEQENLTRMAWSPAATFLGTAAANGGINLWQDRKVTRISTGIGKPASSLSFCPDNSVLAAAFPGVGIRVLFPRAAALANAWNNLDKSGEETVEKELKPAFLSLVKHVSHTSAVAVRPDGQVLAAGGDDGAILLWDTASARLLGQASDEQRHAAAVRGLCFRPDGKQFASASDDGTIRLWGISSQNVPVIIATLSGHRGPVTSLQYAPGGDLLASAGADGSARLWNVSGKKTSAPDLQTYIERRWYSFDANHQQALVWAGGSGFANVPGNSLLGVWRGGGADAYSWLMVANEWNGAAATLPDGGGKELAKALFADAQEAAASNRWNRVDLRMGQLQALNVAFDSSKIESQRAALADEGQSFTNATGVVMVWCQAGSFLMGSPKDEAKREGIETQHRVTLSHGFWLSQYELTQAQWIAIMGSNPSNQKAAGTSAPVENVSWYEAMDFCQRLTDRERASGTLPPGWQYDLPSEAQWEYACRAGTSTPYYFGDDSELLHFYGNFNDKSGNFPYADTSQDDGFEYSAPVGSFAPNAFQFYDMHGNVWEWCKDSAEAPMADYSKTDGTDPLGTTGSRRVDRGGGFFATSSSCRSAFRNSDRPTGRHSSLGLRPALVPCPAKDSAHPH